MINATTSAKLKEWEERIKTGDPKDAAKFFVDMELLLMQISEVFTDDEMEQYERMVLNHFVPMKNQNGQAVVDEEKMNRNIAGFSEYIIDQYVEYGKSIEAEARQIEAQKGPRFDDKGRDLNVEEARYYQSRDFVGSIVSGRGVVSSRLARFLGDAVEARTGEDFTVLIQNMAEVINADVAKLTGDDKKFYEYGSNDHVNKELPEIAQFAQNDGFAPKELQFQLDTMNTPVGKTFIPDPQIFIDDKDKYVAFMKARNNEEVNKQFNLLAANEKSVFGNSKLYDAILDKWKEAQDAKNFEDFYGKIEELTAACETYLTERKDPSTDKGKERYQLVQNMKDAISDNLIPSIQQYAPATLEAEATIMDGAGTTAPAMDETQAAMQDASADTSMNPDELLKLLKTDRFLHINSKAYKDLVEAAETYVNLSKGVDSDGNEVSAEELASASLVLSAMCDNYISAKGNPSTDMGKARLQAAIGFAALTSQEIGIDLGEEELDAEPEKDTPDKETVSMDELEAEEKPNKAPAGKTKVEQKEKTAEKGGMTTGK